MVEIGCFMYLLFILCFVYLVQSSSRRFPILNCHFCYLLIINQFIRLLLGSIIWFHRWERSIESFWNLSFFEIWKYPISFSFWNQFLKSTPIMFLKNKFLKSAIVRFNQNSFSIGNTKTNFQVEIQSGILIKISSWSELPVQTQILVQLGIPTAHSLQSHRVHKSNHHTIQFLKSGHFLFLQFAIWIISQILFLQSQTHINQFRERWYLAPGVHQKSMANRTQLRLN